jgi:8-hydroxy-5-deazaflavin:NADPH oxidoreductase
VSDIAILGAGYVGETLARRLVPSGHTVRIANSRDPETLSRLTSVAGVHPVWASEVFDGADIAILAVNETLVAGLGSDFIDALARVPIVIDSGNYNSRRDGDVPELLAGKPVGQWLSEQLGRPLFRVFNNIQAHDIAAAGRPAGDPERVALPISGPNGAHLARVHALVEELGFEPVYNGELSESWRHQLGTTTYCTNLCASRLRIELATARLDQTLESNQQVYFTGDAVKANMADGLAIMRNQAIALREYFGDEFGDPDANAERLGDN